MDLLGMACQITDIGSAQRMGTALTYARRYALFTLVGIAGEDDLDAPDLAAVPEGGPQPPRPHPQTNGRTTAAGPRGNWKPPVLSAPILKPDQSANLRERLVAQVVDINSADEAAAWAYRSLPAKNTLTAGDAKIVEERFQARLSGLSDSQASTGVSDSPANEGTPDGLATDASAGGVADQSAETEAASQSDVATSKKGSRTTKTRSHGGMVRALGKTVRLRDKEHRKFVLRQPCLVCGRVPSDPHHLTFTQPRAMGNRVSDEFIVPVCRVHHRELHRSGDEIAWWRKFNIDPLPVALRLWQQRRTDGEVIRPEEGTTGAQR
jgi:hypothetical protein